MWKEKRGSRWHRTMSPVVLSDRAGQCTPSPCLPQMAGEQLHPPIPRGNTTGSTFSSSRQFQEALLTTGQACQRLWDSPCLTPSSWRAISRHSSWPGPGQCRLLCLERGFLLQGDKEDSRSGGCFDFAGGIDRVKLAGLLGCGSILHAAVGRTRKQQSPASLQPLKCHSEGVGRARHGRAVLPLNQLQVTPGGKGLKADTALPRQ